MRILNKEKEKSISWPQKVVCEYCETELEIDKEDIIIGVLGMPYIKCPVCKRMANVMDYGIDGIDITKDNIEFPRHFFHSIDGVDLTNDEIREYIGHGIEYFRRNPDSFCYETGTGNTHIMINNYSGDKNYYVVVTKDYYDTFIPYEAEDYAAVQSVNEEFRNTGFVNWKEIKGVTS